MNTASPIHRLRTALRKHGAIGAARALTSRARERLFPKPAPIHYFDRKHGVDTSGLLEARKLRTGDPNDAHNAAYYGTSPSLFRGAIAQWQQSLADTPYQLSDYSLIDIGCGKGRVLMMASDLPFRRIVGIELNPGLAAIAQTNLAKWNASPHACTDVTVHYADVLASDILTDALTSNAPTVPPASAPTLLYLYNPFDEHVMQPLLERLSAISQTRTAPRSRSAPIDILYVHPVHAALFDRTPGISLLWAGDIPIAPEDTAVDSFHSTGQDVHIYRLANPS